MSLFETLKQFFSAPGGSDAAHSGDRDPLMLRVVLLLEAVGAKQEFAETERAVIQGLLRNRYGLSDGEIHDLIAMAAEHHHEAADVYLFSRELSGAMGPEQRKLLMTEIWDVIFADGVVDEDEELFARKMQKMLRLDHPTWIETKLAAKNAAG